MSSAQLEALDGSVYDLPIPTVDGLKADKIRLVLSGGEELDRTNPDDLDYFASLRLGQDVTLTVVCTVTGKPQTFSPSEDGPGTTTLQATLKAHTVKR